MQGWAQSQVPVPGVLIQCFACFQKRTNPKPSDRVPGSTSIAEEERGHASSLPSTSIEPEVQLIIIGKNRRGSSLTFQRERFLRRGPWGLWILPTDSAGFGTSFDPDQQKEPRAAEIAAGQVSRAVEKGGQKQEEEEKCFGRSEQREEQLIMRIV